MMLAKGKYVKTLLPYNTSDKKTLETHPTPGTNLRTDFLPYMAASENLVETFPSTRRSAFTLKFSAPLSPW